MLVEGVIVTVIGMAIVFVFLELMVILMQILAAIVRKFSLEREEIEGIPAPDTTEIAVAIAAAAGFYPGLIKNNGFEASNEIAAAIVAAKSHQTSRG